MKKFKENYKKFREMLSEPRKRAAILLSMYGIFFALLLTLARIGNSMGDTELEQNIINVEYKLMETYNFEFNIEQKLENTKNIFLINGNNDEILSVKKYNHETDSYNDVLLEDEITLNLDLINIDKIINSVSKLEQEYQTKYKDGTTSINYVVPTNLINEQYDDKKTIECTIYYLDSYINKMVIKSNKDDLLHNNDILSSEYIFTFTK